MTALAFRGLRPVLLTLFLVLVEAAPAPAQPDAKPLTDAQKEALKELQRLSQEVAKAEAAGKWDEAAPAAEKLLAFVRTTYGEKSDVAETALGRLAAVHERRADFAAAARCRREALAVRTQLSGPDDWRTTNARLALEQAELLGKLSPEQRGRLAEAARLSQEVVKLRGEGKAAEAVAPAVRALEARKQVLGEKHPEYAAALNEVAGLHQDQGDHAQALPLYEKALEVRKQALGEKHPDYAQSLNNLASLYQEQGEQAKALPLYEKALEVTKKSLGERHAEYALALSNLASVYQEQGDYVRALPAALSASEVFRQALGERHPYYALSLNNLSTLYQAQGDQGRALPLAEKAVEVTRQALGERHPLYAGALHNLAALHRDHGDFARALPLAEKAVEVTRQALGERHPHYANSLDNLAALHKARGEYARALPLYEKAREVRKQALGEKHPDFTLSLNNLGLLFQEQGDDAKALPFFEKAGAVLKQTLGERHPLYAGTLNNLAELYRARGDFGRAEPLCRQSLDIVRRHMEATAAAQSDRQQLRMAADRRGYLDSFLSLTGRGGVTAGADYAALLESKGSVLLRQRRQRIARDLLDEQSPEAGKLFADLQTASRRLAALALSDVPPDRAAGHAKDLAALTDDKERLERELSRLSAAFRQDRQGAQLTPEQFRQLLPEGAALLDFVEYSHSRVDPEKKGRFLFERRLTAFVVRPGRELVRVELGPVKPVAAAVEQWRLTLKRVRPVRGDDDPAVVLRRLLWEPLEKHLDGATTVLISPDGSLSRLPFAALPGKDPAKYLIEEVGLAVVPVPQLLPELLAKGARKRDDPGLLLLGDVDFDAEAGKASGGRTAPADDRAGVRKGWKRLEGTRGEVATIRDSFEQRFADGNVKVLRGAGATEQALRQQAPRHQYVHLATHGFFAPPEVKSALAHDPRRGGDTFGRGGVAGFHPGLLSGIVLAGANRAPEPGQDDGILTALEVAEMDLRKTELVVLSACETGLGEVAGGEGVLGLQRAFQIAGARSVVASLWSVDDEATRKLMERFYANLWEKKMSKLEALRDAQRWMLAEGLKRGLVREDVPEKTDDARTPPYFWAAFVLSGDWR